MGFIRPKNIGGCIMETLLKNSSLEMLREYYFDVKGEYPPIDFTRELRLFNSVVRYSFNRFQEGLSEKDVRSKVKELFKANSWFLQCAIKVGQQLYKKHRK